MAYLYIFVTPQFVSKPCFSRDSASSPQVHFCSKDFPYAYLYVLRKFLEYIEFQETVLFLSLRWKIFLFHKRSRYFCSFTKVKKTKHISQLFLLRTQLLNISQTILHVLLSNILLLISLQYSKPYKKASSIKEKKKICLLNFLSLYSKYYALNSKFMSFMADMLSVISLHFYLLQSFYSNSNKLK